MTTSTVFAFLSLSFILLGHQKKPCNDYVIIAEKQTINNCKNLIWNNRITMHIQIKYIGHSTQEVSNVWATRQPCALSAAAAAAAVVYVFYASQSVRVMTSGWRAMERSLSSLATSASLIWASLSAGFICSAAPFFSCTHRHLVTYCILADIYKLVWNKVINDYMLTKHHNA